MNIKQKIVGTLLSGLAIAGFVAATTLAIPQASSAQSPVATPPARSGMAGDRMAPRGDIGGRDAALAQALGITEDALQTARTKAHEAAIQQAVKDGLITQAQADALLNKTGANMRGVKIDLRGVQTDQEALLASALGITVEKLQAAQTVAAKAELAQAVTDGRLTQAQADLMTARQSLQKYIADKGFYNSAVQSAVKDGVITQAQADAILSEAKPGPLGGGFSGMSGGPGGRGGPRR